MDDLRTSSIELISSLHCKQRKLEREILKKDLQAAIKYGAKQVQANGNIKHTYNGIVYVTDKSCKREVTCYAEIQLPLEKFIIDESLSRQVNYIYKYSLSIYYHDVNTRLLNNVDG